MPAVGSGEHRAEARAVQRHWTFDKEPVWEGAQLTLERGGYNNYPTLMGFPTAHVNRGDQCCCPQTALGVPWMKISSRSSAALQMFQHVGSQ